MSSGKEGAFLQYLEVYGPPRREAEPSVPSRGDARELSMVLYARSVLSQARLAGGHLSLQTSRSPSGTGGGGSQCRGSSSPVTAAVNAAYRLSHESFTQAREMICCVHNTKTPRGELLGRGGSRKRAELAWSSGSPNPRHMVFIVMRLGFFIREQAPEKFLVPRPPHPPGAPPALDRGETPGVEARERRPRDPRARRRARGRRARRRFPAGARLMQGSRFPSGPQQPGGRPLPVG